MKTTNKRRGAKGQAIVLIALSMVMILGFVVLGIDGARYYSFRRTLQNAADTLADRDGELWQKGQQYGAGEQEWVEGYAAGSTVVSTLAPYDSLEYPKSQTLTVDVSLNIQTFFAGLLGQPYQPVSAQAVEILLPRRINAKTQGTITVVSTTCNNAASIHNGGFELPNLVSWNDNNLTAANGHVVNSYHIGQAQYSTHVTVDNDILVPEPLPGYGLPNMSEYDPGGSAALRAGDDYHVYYGDFAPNFNQAGTPPIEGLIRIIDGAFNPKGSPVVGPKGVTIVADGSITISANNIEMSPYMDNLLFATALETSCAGNAIHLSTKQAILTGGIYAPNGGLDLSLSTTVVNGWTWSQTATVAASQSTFTSDGEHTTPVAEPTSWLVK